MYFNNFEQFVTLFLEFEGAVMIEKLYKLLEK